MTEQPPSIIATFDQHTLGLTDQNDASITWHRKAARAVLFDANRRVAIMHFRKTGSYKLPGGGIDEGEDVLTALRRELREETGYEISDVRELGIVEEDRFFCGMHQTSYCFIATAGEFVGTELTEKEAAEGMELEWFNSIDEAITAIESATQMDEDGSEVGLKMMILREIAILRDAQERTSQKIKIPL